MSHPMASTSKFATIQPRADNVSAPRPADADPHHALVRLLAELIVEDYLIERVQLRSGEKEKERGDR